MTNKWIESKLGDMLILQYGKGLPQRDRRNGKFPVIGSGGIVDYHDESYVDGPGIIVGRKGSIGTVYYEKKNFWPIDTVYYVELKSPEFELKFIYYLLLQSNLSSLNTDAAVPGLNRNVAHSQLFSIPPLSTQRKITAILSAYDNLIENNTRRIQILEEMAQAIYREWFVHYRFSGHKNLGMVDSGTELGMVPDEWEVVNLSDVCLITMGQSPKSEFYNEVGEGLPFHQGVRNFGPLFPTDKVYCTIEKRIAYAGDILFSVRAPVGRMNLATRKIVIGRGLGAIQSKNDWQGFTYFQLKEKFHEEDMMGGGTIFKSVTKADMHNIKFLLPPKNILLSFENDAKIILQELRVLTEKNSNLRSTRELLLPKLVSGQIDVSD